MNHWAHTVPTQVGFYWFWGDPHGRTDREMHESKLCIVKVGRVGDRCFYVCDGAFIYPTHSINSASLGQWQVINPPESPKENRYE